MALIVEDGTGKPTANAYVSLADADAYHTACGNTKWTDSSISDANAESAITRASFYIDKRFSLTFIGWKLTVAQALEWPRDNAYDKDGFLLAGIVPSALKRACYEYALRALLVNVLAPDPTPSVPSESMIFGATSGSDRAGGEITKKMVKVGPIEIEKEFKAASVSSSSYKSSLVDGWKIPEYPEADMWIQQLLQPERHTLMRA